MTEAEIHKAVIAHHRALGLPHTHVDTIPSMGAMGQHGLTKGLPDLLVLTPKGTVAFIELKRDGGRLSPAQKAFQADCIALGIDFFVTYGRDQPIQVLEHLGVVRRTA